MDKVKKAVFPVAGFGTRFLPATKAMPKELLPIIDKPLIQYAVEEAIEAGIETLIFVTGRNKRAIEDHFDVNLELENFLISSNNHAKAKMINSILPIGVECIFVRQPEPKGLGDAILRAERAVNDEPFAVLLADDFLVNNSSNTTQNLIEAYSKEKKAQLSAIKVNREDTHKYGIIEPGEHNNKVLRVIEKPAPGIAPSNIASIGRYILTPNIFRTLRDLPLGYNNEVQLADAIDVHAKLGDVEFSFTKSQRFDCGSVEGFLDAISFVYNERKMKAKK